MKVFPVIVGQVHLKGIHRVDHIASNGWLCKILVPAGSYPVVAYEERPSFIYLRLQGQTIEQKECQGSTKVVYSHIHVGVKGPGGCVARINDADGCSEIHRIEFSDERITWDKERGAEVWEYQVRRMSRPRVMGCETSDHLWPIRLVGHYKYSDESDSWFVSLSIETSGHHQASAMRYQMPYLWEQRGLDEQRARQLVDELKQSGEVRLDEHWKPR